MEEMKNQTCSGCAGAGGGCPLHRLNWASASLWLEVAVALIAFLLLRYAFVFIAWYIVKNRRPGQVKAWPVIGSLTSVKPHWHRLYDYFTDLQEENEVVWIGFAFGLDGLYIVEPTQVEYILKTNFPNYPKGTAIQERMRELLGHGIFAADGQQWKDTRKIASLEFSSAILRNFSADIFKERSIMLTRIVSQFAQSRTPMNIQDLLMRMTLDATCKVGFGVELGCLTPSLPEVPFAMHFDWANELSFHRYMDAFWKVKKFLNVGNEKILKMCVDEIDKFCYIVIKKRRLELEAQRNDGSTTKPDLLTRFMTTTEKFDEAYSDKALRDHVLNFIIAGRDTTAITLSWFIYMICLHPEVAEKVYEEVRNLEENHSSAQNSEGPDDPITRCAEVLTFYSVPKLQYLHAALTETLRLYPPVPMDGKVADNDDVLPGGVRVRKGNLVTYNAYSMARLERVWGPDAKEYKPERWLKDGVFQQESHFKFVSFHAGNRACLGKESAYLQMKIAAGLLIRLFKFELVPNQEIRPRVMLVLTMAEGLKVIATPR